MSSPNQPPPPPEPPPARPPAPPEFDIPNAEKYMLEADVMRRRQLRSALLHGSTRTWREHRKVWPAVIAGVVASGLIIAVIAVKSAYDKDRDNQQADELTAFCDSARESESVLTETDFDLGEPDEVDDAADTARDLAGTVPDHVADEIDPPVQTIADQYEEMDEAEADSDRVAELATSAELGRAQQRLTEFIDNSCE